MSERQATGNAVTRAASRLLGHRPPPEGLNELEARFGLTVGLLFLFGRRTYEIFASYWGAAMTHPHEHPIAAASNSRPEYVVTTTLREPQWENTTVISGDVAPQVAALKSELDGELQVHGSGNLTRWLFTNQLVDEMTLLVRPVVLGQGILLFAATGPDAALDLSHAQSTGSGVTIQTYRVAGPPRYELAAPSSRR